jgi:hypothetical protein
MKQTRTGAESGLGVEWASGRRERRVQNPEFRIEAGKE